MHFDPSGGGADRYFSGLLGGLQDLGADVSAAAFGLPGPEIASALPLGGAMTGLLARLQAIRRLRPALREPGRLVATHFALYALPLSPLRHVPHVVHFHGPWAGESAREGQNALVIAAKRWVERQVYGSATRLVALSTAFRDILCSEYGVPEHRVCVIPGGVDISRFRPAENQTAARLQINWPPEKKIILCVRRLVNRMGLENLVAAFAQIAPRHPDALLHVAGRGPLAEELRAQATALGVSDQVRLVGFLSDHDLPTAYAAADFSIVPSGALEGFGLITLESLACGTPVLVTPVGGLPEAVSALDPGLVLKGCDVEALAEGLARALAGGLPSSHACREYAANGFAWPQIARRVLAVYEEAANDSSR